MPEIFDSFFIDFKMFENKSLIQLGFPAIALQIFSIFADENISIRLSYEMSSKSHSTVRSCNSHKSAKQLPA